MTEEMNPTNEREPNAAGQGPQPKEKLSFRQMYRKLLQLDDTPHSIALGAALGMFITFTPTVGIQVLIVLILSMVVRFNRFAAIVLIYLSNPVTIIPIYYADYVIGLFVQGESGLSLEEFVLLWDQSVITAGEVGFWGATQVLFKSLGTDVIIPMFIGGGVLGGFVGVVTYPLTLSWVQRYREGRQGDNHQDS
ncbi:MAG: DUF2062 domain-containing protein [Planctomycetia bacterium]|nr:DUF2062 domain-containing protein [Planctomycetia bacterium]MBL6914446.1 DUF2062 domain-containing protein [Planctomycetota bacterium]